MARRADNDLRYVVEELLAQRPEKDYDDLLAGTGLKASWLSQVKFGTIKEPSTPSLKLLAGALGVDWTVLRDARDRPPRCPEPSPADTLFEFAVQAVRELPERPGDEEAARLGRALWRFVRENPARADG